MLSFGVGWAAHHFWIEPTNRWWVLHTLGQRMDSVILLFIRLSKSWLPTTINKDERLFSATLPLCRVYSFGRLSHLHAFCLHLSSRVLLLAKVSKAQRKKRVNNILSRLNPVILCRLFHCHSGSPASCTSVPQVKYHLICYMWSINLPNRPAVHVCQGSQVVVVGCAWVNGTEAQ